MVEKEITCPGCGLARLRQGESFYTGGYNASPECWKLFTQILGRSFGDGMLYGQVHQLAVDAYAAQHAGGNHGYKSAVVHLAGLHLVLERGEPPTSLAPLLQRLAGALETWPHLPPPDVNCPVTVQNVVAAKSPEDHANQVWQWADSVWRSWVSHHEFIREFVARHVGTRKTEPETEA